MRRTSPQLLSALLLLTLARPATPQDIEIKGAQIALETKSIPVEIVTLENKRDSPLVAWQIAFTKEGLGGRIHTSDFTWQSRPPSMRSGPIKPGERRVIEIDLRHRDAEFGSPTLNFAAFEDGYVEGMPDAIDLWQKQRRERVEDADYWARTLGGIPVGPDADLKRYLQIKVGERAAESANDVSGLRNRLANVLRQTIEPGRLAGLIEPIRVEAAWLKETLTQRPSKAPSLEPSAPVLMSSKRDATTQYAVVITNLRDVAVEAVGFDLLDPISQLPTGGQGADYCSTDVGTRTSGTGRIGGRDSREFPLFIKTRDPNSAPIPRLTFVMFDDLSYEGSSTKRAEILAYREREANDISYLLTVRAEGASKPPGELAAFINAKRLERAKTLGSEANQARLHYFDELIRRAQSETNPFRDDDPYFQHLEKYRAQLLRHVKP